VGPGREQGALWIIDVRSAPAASSVPVSAIEPLAWVFHKVYAEVLRCPPAVAQFCLGTVSEFIQTLLDLLAGEGGWGKRTAFKKSTSNAFSASRRFS